MRIKFTRCSFCIFLHWFLYKKLFHNYNSFRRWNKLLEIDDIYRFHSGVHCLTNVSIDEQKKLKLKKKEKKVHGFFWLLRVLVHQQQYHLQYHIHFYHEGFWSILYLPNLRSMLKETQGNFYYYLIHKFTYS
jgi:hypothetical protein